MPLAPPSDMNCQPLHCFWMQDVHGLYRQKTIKMPQLQLWKERRVWKLMRYRTRIGTVAGCGGRGERPGRCWTINWLHSTPSRTPVGCSTIVLYTFTVRVSNIRPWFGHSIPRVVWRRSVTRKPTVVAQMVCHVYGLFLIRNLTTEGFLRLYFHYIFM